MKPTISILRNGTRLVLAPLQDTRAVTILIMFNVGSRHEVARDAGVAHFVEHMIFKGTKSIPDPLLLSHTLDALGAEYNAFTGKDYTGYYIKVAAEKADRALEIIADMVKHPLFPEEEFHKERGTIMEELKMYEDNPIMSIDDFYYDVAFPRNPLGRDVGGTQASLKRIKYKWLVDFYKQHYTAQNMVVAVAGKIQVSVWKKKLQSDFKTVKRGRRNYFKSFKDAQKTPRLGVKKKDVEQVALMMGFPTVPRGHKDREALSVLTTILGGGMSSRLFVEVREKRGLCYYIRASVSLHDDVGVWSIGSGLRQEKITEAVPLIWEELRKMKTELVSNEELQKAKDMILGRTILGMEDSSSVAQFYARQLLFQGQVEQLPEKIARIKTVTPAQVQKVAQALIQKDKLSLAVIGPFQGKAKFEKVVRGLE